MIYIHGETMTNKILQHAAKSDFDKVTNGPFHRHTKPQNGAKCVEMNSSTLGVSVSKFTRMLFTTSCITLMSL